MGDAALALFSVTKNFGGIKAVSNISMQVMPGERRVIIGPNGAGKTSLFHCISGALEPTSGSIHCFGQDITYLSEPLRTQCGVGRTFQISSVFTELTVLENISLAVLGIRNQKWNLWSAVRDVADLRAKADEQLNLVGLPNKQNVLVKSLSYGERRQLELVLALVNGPRLLLLDEPCAGLSPAERHRLFSIIEKLPRSITMLMIEHDMDIALGLADRVSVLHQGEMIVEGSVQEVKMHEKVREVYFGKV
jgi:branched-chain amino acid transport system ATP-binding protein